MQAEVVVEAGPEAGRRVTLAPGQQLILGRGEDADVKLDADGASRRHLAVALTPEGLVATDLGSKNGTLLDGSPLPANTPTPVEDGVLQVGASLIRLRRLDRPRLRDEYERLAELGRGAAGIVFAARHRASGRTVAVKTLLDKVDLPPAARDRFLREGRVRLDSPHVVQVYDVRIEDGQVYLVMELVEGESLQRHLHQAGGRLPVAEAQGIGAQIAQGLAVAHAAGVIHRDIKPANVMLTQGGVVKITDFGIAKVQGASHSLTASGTGLGTLTYIAPEQAEDAKRIGPGSDLYSLGATLYHLLAGRPPFLPGPDLIQQLFEDEPPPLRTLRPDCPPALARLVLRLLEKEPEDRPRGAAEVAAELRKLGA